MDHPRLLTQELSNRMVALVKNKTKPETCPRYCGCNFLEGLVDEKKIGMLEFTFYEGDICLSYHGACEKNTKS